MSGSALAAEELLRVAALHASGLLAAGREERFDRVARIAARLLDAPIAMVNLIDEDMQWAKACVGLPSGDMPRGISFCGHAVLGDEPLVVPDTLADPRFAANPLVTGEPGLRAYVGRPVRDPEGHVLGTLCVSDVRTRDWTREDLAALNDLAGWVELEIGWAALREAGARRRAAEDRLDAVIDGAAEGIVTLDREGRAGLVNPAAQEMLGFDRAELTGRVFHELAHHHRADGSPYPAEECPTHLTLTEGATHRLLEEVYWRKDGTPLPVDLSSTPILDDGEVAGAVVVFRDATERRELERMKRDFVSSVSHELRTPLTSIRGYLEALLEEESGPLTDEQREDLEVVWRNAHRLHALIDDLLLLSRVEAGRLQLSCRRLSLDGLVAGLLRDVAPDARRRGLTVEASLSPVAVEGDEQRLQQCFSNLLSNAVKFGRPGTRVRVVAGPREGQALVEVADEGPGIPADELARLGERFFRASTARSVEGTGLGLTITREIVERHDGRLEVESEVGKGSRFRVLLPQAGDA